MQLSNRSTAAFNFVVNLPACSGLLGPGFSFCFMPLLSRSGSFVGVYLCGLSAMFASNVLTMVVYTQVVASWVAASNCSNSLWAFTESGSLLMAL